MLGVKRRIWIIDNTAEARFAHDPGSSLFGTGVAGSVDVELQEEHLQALREGKCVVFGAGDYAHFLVLGRKP